MPKDRDKTIRLRGIVSSGVQQSALFTEVPWVKKQFVEKLGISPYPGTFNVTIVPEDRDKLDRIKAARGITIVPEDPSFCSASSFHVVVGNKIKGAAIIPLVSSYPPAQLEIISTERIRSSLSLQEGDSIDIEVYIDKGNKSKIKS